MSFPRVIVVGSLCALFWGALALAGGTTSTTTTSGTTTTSTTATTGTKTTGTTSTTGETGETGETGNEDTADTGETDDTGDSATVVDSVDTGLDLDTAITYPASAASMAGEQGGCACQTAPSFFSLALPLSALIMLVAWTRRRRFS